MACIFFHPEAYTTSGPKLMGRNAAGESFLRGYIRHTQDECFWVQVEDSKHAAYFAEIVSGLAPAKQVRSVDNRFLPALAEAGVCYHPGPGLGTHAWRRAAYGHSSWSLCGITHTTSSTVAMDALTELIAAPVQPWDALICTSTAVKNNVERILQAQVDYLEGRLGISRLVLPQMPVIPLGIHTEDFDFSDQDKSAARRLLKVDEDALVVMYMGRLSFHAKAHPLAMYQALEAAAQQTGKQIVLVECGWFANEYIAKSYAEAARVACPSVRVVNLDGRDAKDRNTAWAAGDIFCSLSDNIQETFGVVPIEAMAAGLPVVVSDWDGYRDTVRDGVDGFRVPTIMPATGMGGDLALRHALEIDTYDMYCGHACSLIAVDVERTTQAFVRLFKSAELRLQMGSAARQRAKEVFDWSNIIPRYEDLWHELNERRREAIDGQGRSASVWPARKDPFDIFAAYPSATLQSQTLLQKADVSADLLLERVAVYRDLEMVNFANVMLPSQSEVEIVLRAASSTPRFAADLVKDVAPERQVFVFRALTWLVKLGVLKVSS